jgi:hypothetical protein
MDKDLESAVHQKVVAGYGKFALHPIIDEFCSVYRTAVRLIEKHGNKAMSEANRLIDLTLERQDDERLLVMLQIRQAIVSLQTPASETLH